MLKRLIFLVVAVVFFGTEFGYADDLAPANNAGGAAVAPTTDAPPTEVAPSKATSNKAKRDIARHKKRKKRKKHRRH